MAVCGRRFGKALALSTPLPSPTGWTDMGSVREGDQLFDEQGAICKVVLVSQVMSGRPCNRIRFDDGTSIVADNDHLWEVRPTGREDSARVIQSTSEIARRLKQATHHQVCIASCQALQLAEDTQDQRGPRYGVSRQGLRSSIEQRHRLLRDLSERLGVSRRGGWSYLFCHNRALTRYVLELLRSLGFIPYLEAGADRQAGTRWVSWQSEAVLATRRITSIEPVKSVAVRCIQVDSRSRLYLCGEGMVPTHNTFLMAEEIRRAARLAIRYGVGIENEIWYGAPTFIQAKRVMWARLKKTIPTRWLSGNPNETSCVMRLQSGHVIRIVGLDASENLRGSGLWFFGGDEWADCRPEVWNEVIRPMLSTSRGHALFIGTPKGFDHFRDAYLLGQSGGDPAYKSFLFTTLDGGNVPPDEVVAAQQQLDPRTFRQEYGASFESYAGRVIYAFSRAENVRQFSCDLSRPLHIGMDFNINPMSATVWQEDGETARQVDEIILPTSNTDELTAEIIRRYGRAGFDPSNRSVDHITIYPDPAGAQRRSSAGGRTDIGILREAGFHVVTTASHPPVRDRINLMNRQFLSADGIRRAFVNAACVKSIEAYERLIYREGTSDPDKSTGHDHLVDASGYYLFGRTLRRTGSNASTSHIMER